MGWNFRSFYIGKLEPKKCPAVIEALKQEGLVTFDGISSERDLLRMARMLGTVKLHRDSQKNGITRIATKSANTVQDSYLGFTSHELFPHTDGSSQSIPPSLVLLLCIKPAELGGDSIFVDGKTLFTVFQKDYPVALNILSRPKSAIFAGSGNICWSSIFSNFPSGEICLRFRYDDWGYYSAPTMASLKLFVDTVQELSFSISLKANQGYIVKNTRWLHGRTPFQGTREMLRVLIDTKGLGF